jgi:pimeloyl-ACP methyl ester carboxylesterase
MAQPRFITVNGKRLEYRWFGPRPESAPTLLFLHEGLGCAAMWRDFPARLAAATGCGASIYSRLGYGHSDAHPLPWPVSYMHDEGLIALPALALALGLGDVILVGHSDGASIALINAGGAPLANLRGVIVEAPHVFVEDISVTSIGAAGQAYRRGDLKARLKRFHGSNVDCAFFGWHDAWLSPEFAKWNIETYLPAITMPVQVIQGETDEYGTVAQVQAIQDQLGGLAEVLILPECGHSPHRDQGGIVLAAMTDFIRRILKR